MQTAGLTITEVAKRAGLRPSAIRYYERVGLLPPPERHNSRRRYSTRVLQQLQVIATAQRMGFTIAEIGTLLNGFSADTPAWQRWQTLAREKLPEIATLIRNAMAMRALLEQTLHCECLTLEECAALMQDHASGTA